MALYCLAPFAANAQIVPDNTLGAESSRVFSTLIDNSPSKTIDGGATRGLNLFHSFREFNITEQGITVFSSPTGIQNILVRVTGSNPSGLFGAFGVKPRDNLSADSNANLFLINPNGIQFRGREARFISSGSFIASTASSVVFGNGIEFSAINPQPIPLLAINVPTGLQFRLPVAQITLSDALFDIGGIRAAGQSPSTLGLIGGNLSMTRGRIAARGGSIELGAIAAGTVDLNVQGSIVSFGYPNDLAKADIYVDVRSANIPGISGPAFSIGTSTSRSSVNIIGRNIEIRGTRDNTAEVGFFNTISTETVSGVDPSLIKAGDITLNATEQILVRDGATISAATNTSSRGGNINVITKQLIVQDGSFLSVNSKGSGQAGDLTITASEFVKLINGGSVNTAATLAGSAGNLNITTPSIYLDRGEISATTSRDVGGTFGKINILNTGNITLQAIESIVMRRGSNITTSSQQLEGGTININTGVLATIPSENNNIIANGGTRILLNTSIFDPISFPPSFIGKNVFVRGSDLLIGSDGGNINIAAQGIFGFQKANPFGQKTNPLLSGITASGGLDASQGQITFTTPEVNPSNALIQLPETVVDPNALIAQNPCAKSGGSEFIVSGTGGLPSAPNDALNSSAVKVGLVEPTKPSQNSASANVSAPSEVSAKRVVPAQGWVVNDRGELVLTAYDPTGKGVNRFAQGLPPTVCKTP